MSLSTQFYTMLAMIAMGSFFGGSLDTYQRFLKRGRRKKFFVFINDILFWIIQALIAFYVLFLVNQGELRFYLLLALLCGFSAYQALMKNIYMSILEQIISFIKATARFISKMFLLLIFRPIKALLLLIVTLVSFIGKVLFSLVKLVYKMLLWVSKVLTYPIFLLGKGFYYFVPKPIKKFVQRLYMVCAGYLKSFKNLFMKIKKWFEKMIRK